MENDLYQREIPYGVIAQKVDLSMELSSRSCRGGECDVGAPCPRHLRIVLVVDRYLRLKRRLALGRQS